MGELVNDYKFVQALLKAKVSFGSGQVISKELGSPKHWSPLLGGFALSLLVVPLQSPSVR